MKAVLLTPDHPDYLLILGKLPELAQSFYLRLKAKGAMPYSAFTLETKVSEAIRYMSSDFTVYVAGPCIVAVTMGKAWWSAGGLVMGEEFVARYKPGNFADTLTELEGLARDNGCRAIVLSSLAVIREESYGHYLKRKGFTRMSQEYMKGLT